MKCHATNIQEERMCAMGLNTSDQIVRRVPGRAISWQDEVHDITLKCTKCIIDHYYLLLSSHI